MSISKTVIDIDKPLQNDLLGATEIFLIVSEIGKRYDVISMHLEFDMDFIIVHISLNEEEGPSLKLKYFPKSHFLKLCATSGFWACEKKLAEIHLQNISLKQVSKIILIHLEYSQAFLNLNLVSRPYSQNHKFILESNISFAELKALFEFLALIGAATTIKCRFWTFGKDNIEITFCFIATNLCSTINLNLKLNRSHIHIIGGGLDKKKEYNSLEETFQFIIESDIK